MKKRDTDKNLLIGNSFPFSLIQKRVTIDIVEPEKLVTALKTAEIFSFWGHQNSLKAANEFIEADLRPNEERPVLTLSANKYPVLNGIKFDVCWVLSPIYKESFRPLVGQEVAPEFITGWQVKLIKWR